MSQTQQRLIGVLLLVVVLAGAWMLLLSPALEERETARDELAQAQSAEAAAQATRQTAERALVRLPENRRAITELARVVPEQAESAALLDRINALARRSDVRFDSLELAGTGDAAAGGGDSAAPGEESASGDDAAASGGAQAQQVPVTLQVRGTYPRVVALLRRLHGRGATLGGGRLLRLDAVGLARDDDEDAPPDRLVVDITAVAFVLPAVGEGGAAPAPAPTAGAATSEPATTANAPGGTG